MEHQRLQLCLTMLPNAVGFVVLSHLTINEIAELHCSNKNCRDLVDQYLSVPNLKNLTLMLHEGTRPSTKCRIPILLTKCRGNVSRLCVASTTRYRPLLGSFSCSDTVKSYFHNCCRLVLQVVDANKATFRGLDLLLPTKFTRLSTQLLSEYSSSYVYRLPLLEEVNHTPFSKSSLHTLRNTPKLTELHVDGHLDWSAIKNGDYSCKELGHLSSLWHLRVLRLDLQGMLIPTATIRHLATIGLLSLQLSDDAMQFESFSALSFITSLTSLSLSVFKADLSYRMLRQHMTSLSLSLSPSFADPAAATTKATTQVWVFPRLRYLTLRDRWSELISQQRLRIVAPNLERVVLRAITHKQKRPQQRPKKVSGADDCVDFSFSSDDGQDEWSGIHWNADWPCLAHADITVLPNMHYCHGSLLRDNLDDVPTRLTSLVVRSDSPLSWLDPWITRLGDTLVCLESDMGLSPDLPFLLSHLTAIRPICLDNDAINACQHKSLVLISDDGKRDTVGRNGSSVRSGAAAISARSPSSASSASSTSSSSASPLIPLLPKSNVRSITIHRTAHTVSSHCLLNRRNENNFT